MQKFFLYAFLFIAGMAIGYYVAIKTQGNNTATEATVSTEPTNQNAVTMESYSDDGSDAYIALKNNTTKTLRELTFRIIYLDLQGNQLDYRDFTQSTELEPGLVKRFDIKEYDTFRYRYYQTESRYSSIDCTPYKIQYQLLGYE